MKFIHCSDIHLGRKPAGAFGVYTAKRYEDYFVAFDHIADTAIEKNVDLLIISGDLTDKRELQPEVLDKTERILGKLKKAGIYVVAIEGNHDNITPGRESESWLLYLENKGLLKRPFTKFEEGEYRFYPFEFGGFKLYGLGYPGLFIDEVLASLAIKLENTDPENNIIIVHTAIAGNEHMAGTASSQAVAALKGMAVYVAGGHFHSFNAIPKSEPYFFVPGSPEYWELSEHSQKKGMILFDTETKEHEFIESKKRRIIYRNIINKSDNESEFIDEFRALANTLDIEANEDIVKIDIIHNNHFFIDTALCETIIKGNGALKASVELKSPDKATTLFANTNLTGTGQIEREIISGWKEFSPFLDLTAAAIDKMKVLAEEEQPELIYELFDNFLESILGKGDENENK